MSARPRPSDNPDGAALGSTAPLAYPSSKAASDQFCRSVAAQLRPLGVSIIDVNPGFVHTELVDLLAEAGVDVSQSTNIDNPVRALAYLAGCDDPLVFSGQTLTAETIVDELGLKTPPLLSPLRERYLGPGKSRARWYRRIAGLLGELE